MAQVERQQAVLNILQGLRDLHGLRQLFAELNYDYAGQPLSTRGLPHIAKAPLAGDPVLFASGGEDNAFHVIYCRLAKRVEAGP